MRRFLLTTLFFFSCFSAQAAYLPEAVPAQKTHRDGFFADSADLHREKIIYLIDTQQSCEGFCSQDAYRPMYLWYYRARMYSSELGRFISRDPIGYADGWNLYAGYFAGYFGMDPSGLGPQGARCRLTESCKENIRRLNDKINALSNRLEDLRKWNNRRYYRENRPPPGFDRGWPGNENKWRNYWGHIEQVATVVGGITRCELIILVQWTAGCCTDNDIDTIQNWEVPTIPAFQTHRPWRRVIVPAPSLPFYARGGTTIDAVINVSADVSLGVGFIAGGTAAIISMPISVPIAGGIALGATATFADEESPGN